MLHRSDASSLGCFIASVASAPLRELRLESVSFPDWLAIPFAVFAGLLAQTVEGALILVLMGVHLRTFNTYDSWQHIPRLRRGAIRLAQYTLHLVPFAGLGFAIYRYFSGVGEGQHTVAVAFVGGVLIILIAISLTKGIMSGALLRRFMTWLRGDRDK
jgi:hypothetical protein